MKKYNIEDNIDFFFELNKLLNNEKNANEETLPKEKDVCLISNEKLVDKFVKLKCGHTFNYIPLFKDLVNQKQKFHTMDISQLKKDEIRCPYCRSTQQGVLPYYEELGLPKTNGVNTIENYEINLCEYSIPNLNFNPMLPEDETDGNNKLIVCLNAGSKISGKNYGNDKYYCSYHKKIVIHYAKEELKLIKQAEKEMIKEEKLHKQFLKQQKINKIKEQKIKEQTKPSIPENIVLMNNSFIDLSGNNFVDSNIIVNSNIIEKCSKLIKTGVNKGKECGCKIYNDNLCKRHYSLMNVTK